MSDHNEYSIGFPVTQALPPGFSSQTLEWSKLGLDLTPDSFKTAYGVSFSRSIVFSRSQDLLWL